MERKIVITEDGSYTVSIPEMGVTYHSIHGAIQESMHVFIEAGFNYVFDKLNNDQIRILEVGFGTGLNALLTAIEAKKAKTSIYYVAMEPYPLTDEEVQSLNYCDQLARKDLQESFISMHQCEWNKNIVVTKNLLLHKSNYTLQTFEQTSKFDLVYFDAFDPNVQPELWTKEIFEKLFSILEPNGILVTYSSKGDVRRALQSAGFTVEKIPGAKGKREMIRAEK
jgi:tRNA U34 5-methylaminomethyl-2-thiouridine-forming methyltransferase MnmC